MGPTTRSISVTGGVTWDELREHYFVQASGLWEGGADLLLVETSQDTLNVKAALAAIDDLSDKLGIEIPVAVQCTIETMGTTLGGQDVEAFLRFRVASQPALGGDELLHRAGIHGATICGRWRPSPAFRWR